ncbi:hypothetical protein [Clostridium beijerinckii]|uniref:hypothetical protein n=1 Tax=Clostridium beijerinckii TaxID=1520 RepID=UPI00047B5A3E|nr:hypothetical protein [Clostridium beijerinckii]
MKKYMLAFLIFLLLIFHMLTIPVGAEPKTLNQGFYKVEDLNLSKGVHTVQNASPTDYAFIAIFDSNQLTRQYMRLDPQSAKYTLIPLETGFDIIVSSKSGIIIN